MSDTNITFNDKTLNYTIEFEDYPDSKIATSITVFDPFIMQTDENSANIVDWWGFVRTDSDALRMRQSPSTESEIVQTIPKDEMVDVLFSTGDWLYVAYNNICGYVSAEYIGF